MEQIIFESKLLPNGHLFCPKEFARKKNARFRVIVTLGKSWEQATDAEIEAAAVADVSEDFLSEDELGYYLKLEE